MIKEFCDPHQIVTVKFLCLNFIILVFRSEEGKAQIQTLL